jgi:hypothetical protein
LTGFKKLLSNLVLTAKDLPARLLAAQVAKLINYTTEDVAILVTSGKLRPPGRPNLNAVKFFSAVELITQLVDREWLTGQLLPYLCTVRGGDRATKFQQQCNGLGISEVSDHTS